MSLRKRALEQVRFRLRAGIAAQERGVQLAGKLVEVSVAVARREPTRRRPVAAL